MTVDTTETRDPLAELDAQARASYDEGDHQAAKQVWEAILQMDPEHQGALQGLERVSQGDSAAGDESSESVEETPTPDSAGEGGGTTGAFDPVLLAGLARAREKLDSGEVDSARALVEELAQDNPDHPEIAELRARCEGGAPAAPEAAPADAAPAFDLELDLASPEPATPAPPAPAVEPSAGGFDLDIELPGAPAPPALDTPVPAQLTPAEQEQSRELLDAVGELGVERPVEGLQLGQDEDPLVQPEPDQAEEPAAGEGPANEEAEALVAEARDALSVGDTETAMQVAARAMAMDEKVHGAAEILEDARALEAARHDEAERHLSEGIAEFEQGRAAEAIPCLEKALLLVPGHAEAEAFLAQARQAASTSSASPSGPLEFDGSELDGVAALPLVTPAGSAESSTGPVAGDANTGPAGGGAPDLLPPPPVDIPMPGMEAPAAGGAELPPPPPVPDAPAPADAGPGAMPPSPAAPATPAPPAVPRARKQAGGGRSRVVLLAILALVVLGAGGWYAVTSLGLLGGEDPDNELIRAPVQRARVTPPAAREVQPAPAGQPDASREQASAPAPAEVSQPGIPEAAQPSAPRYSRADVPRLMAQADQALASGRPKDAVELLVAAQSADPVNFDLIEKLEAARTELRQAEEAQSRLESGRLSFKQGQYDEALRIFYRVPASHRPEQLDSWIALGWYNLGVRSLQSGNVHEALKFFNDSLDHAPNDPLTLRNREVAVRYSSKARDEAYRIYVNSLKTRELPR